MQSKSRWSSRSSNAPWSGTSRMEGSSMALEDSNTALATRARATIPGGVNSGNRGLPWPMAITEASGAYITDADGKRYLDYHAAFGPVILGHSHPAVNAAVHATID